MLGDSWFGVLKHEESLGDISRHAEIHGASGVIPVKVDAAEERTISIHGDFVVFLKTFFKMRDMVVRGGFDAKVVNDKAEDDVTKGTLKPEASAPSCCQ